MEQFNLTPTEMQLFNLSQDDLLRYAKLHPFRAPQPQVQPPQQLQQPIVKPLQTPQQPQSPQPFLLNNTPKQTSKSDLMLSPLVSPSQQTKSSKPAGFMNPIFEPNQPFANETDLRRYLHKYEHLSPKKDGLSTPSKALDRSVGFIPSTPAPSYFTPPGSPLPSPFLSSPQQLIPSNFSQPSFTSTPITTTPIRLRSSPAVQKLQPTPNTAALEEQNAQITFETNKITPTLKNLNIEKPWNRWVLNIRKWLSYEIDNLNLRIKNCNEAMAKLGLSNNDCFTAFKNANELMPYFMKNNPSAELLRVLRERFELENFLDLHSNRKYVINRLIDLAKQTFSLPLSQVVFNGGGDYEGIKWNESLPTDVHVVMHIFRTLFDLKTNYIEKGPRTFSAKHFMDLSLLTSNLEKKNKLPKSGLWIIQTQKYPPHYFIRHGEVNYLTESGRENIFQTIVLFLAIVKENYMNAGMGDFSAFFDVTNRLLDMQ